MTEWLAPAKVNLDLRVRPPDSSGNHPIRSLMQTLEWCDRLVVEEGDEDRLTVIGAELPEGDNLVWRAVRALDLRRPPLDMTLVKEIAVAAGLGGGSADAAAALAAVVDLVGVDDSQAEEVAPEVGADVPFLLVGGTAVVEGFGELVTPVAPLSGFAVAVAVAPFELSTAEVYDRWDRLGGPVGPAMAASSLPPGLRRGDDLGNDLVPAALDLRPELAEWMSELSRLWGRMVLMSGSGPACFGLFLDHDEATSAVASVRGARTVRAAPLRRVGVFRAEG